MANMVSKIFENLFMLTKCHHQNIIVLLSISIICQNELLSEQLSKKCGFKFINQVVYIILSVRLQIMVMIIKERKVQWFTTNIRDVLVFMILYTVLFVFDGITSILMLP